MESRRRAALSRRPSCCPQGVAAADCTTEPAPAAVLCEGNSSLAATTMPPRRLLVCTGRHGTGCGKPTRPTRGAGASAIVPRNEREEARELPDAGHLLRELQLRSALSVHREQLDAAGRPGPLPPPARLQDRVRRRRRRRRLGHRGGALRRHAAADERRRVARRSLPRRERDRGAAREAAGRLLRRARRSGGVIQPAHRRGARGRDAPDRVQRRRALALDADRRRGRPGVRGLRRVRRELDDVGRRRHAPRECPADDRAREPRAIRRFRDLRVPRRQEHPLHDVPVERVERGKSQNATAVGIVTIGAALVAWLVTIDRMRGRDMGPGTDLGSFGWYLGVWVTMTAAMMLPSALPMLLLVRRTAPEPPSTWFSAAGYLAAWTVYGLAAYGLYRLLAAVADGVLAWDRAGRWAAGAAIAAAGAYQLTPLKNACLRHCRSPLGFLLHRRRDGAAGAAELGARHGLYCIGCCAG